MRPYYHNGVARDYYWPVETDGSRYSCQTNIGGSIPSPFSLPVTQTFSMRFEDVVDRCGDDEDATVRLL